MWIFLIYQQSQASYFTLFPVFMLSLNKQLLTLASYTAYRHERLLISSSDSHAYLHKLFNCSFKTICNGYTSINIKRWRSCDHSRIVSHDVTHVHLDGKLFQVDGEHHQCLPRRSLLTCCLTVLTEGRSGCFCHRIWRRINKHWVKGSRGLTGILHLN